MIELAAPPVTEASARGGDEYVFRAGELASRMAAVRAAGLRPLLWSRWGKDWRKFTTAAKITSRAVGDVQDGDVILLHDADFYSSVRSHQRTAAALPGILAKLKSAELGTVACA